MLTPTQGAVLRIVAFYRGDADVYANNASRQATPPAAVALPMDLDVIVDMLRIV